MGRGRRLTEDSRVTERLLLMPNSFEVCPSTSQLAPLRQLIHRGYIRPNSPIAACNNIVIYLSRSKIHENFCQAFFNISPRSPLEPPYRAPVRFIRKQAKVTGTTFCHEIKIPLGTTTLPMQSNKLISSMAKSTR